MGTHVVATLGSPTTFAGRATSIFMSRRHDDVRVDHLPSMDDLWRALIDGVVDAIVLSADSTGGGPGASVRQLLTAPRPFHVDDELLVPYHCSLFGKPGSDLDEIRTVLGHGSVNQCSSFLRRRLPDAEVRILHDQSSAAAAELVAVGDGTSAVVAPPGAGSRLGLAELARDIDEGAVGLWWTIGREPCPHAQPQRLVIAGRLPGDGGLGALVERVAEIGHRLETAYSLPSREEVGDYHYLLTFGGPPVPLASVEDVLAAAPSTWLVGAFEQQPPRYDEHQEAIS